MKIERINEDQISCTLTSGDLDIRNMKLNDLGYGSYQARTLCKEMLRRAASELGFETDENPIMVETIPMADNSIVMIITKVEDPEEMDARFSTFYTRKSHSFSRRRRKRNVRRCRKFICQRA